MSFIFDPINFFFNFIKQIKMLWKYVEMNAWVQCKIKCHLEEFQFVFSEIDLFEICFVNDKKKSKLFFQFVTFKHATFVKLIDLARLLQSIRLLFASLNCIFNYPWLWQNNIRNPRYPLYVSHFKPYKTLTFMLGREG